MPTSVLHGTWLPERRRFLWWSESPDPLDPNVLRALQGPRGGRGGPPWFDRLSAPDPILKDLERILQERQSEFADQKNPGAARLERILHESLHVVFLLPLRESRVCGSVDPPDALPPQKLAPFTIPGLATVPVTSFKCLLALPQGRPIRGQTPGDDIILWQLAAQLARDLLAAGDYLPGLVEGRAAWVPVLETVPEYRRRVEALCGAMPTLCRAGASRAGRLPDAEEILRDFLGTVIDSCVNQFDGTSLGAVGASSAWLSALYADRQDGRTSVWTAPSELASSWARWSSPAGAAADESDARTCLRLEAPERAELHAEGGVAAHGWRLSFHLQAIDDPSLLVAAIDVWETRSRTLRRLDRRFRAPQERLLSDLARAARHFEPLRRALQEARPEVLDLRPDEVRDFVSRAATELRSEGFGVLLPSWEQAGRETGGGVRLHMRLRPRTVAGASAGGRPASTIGLAAMCDFQWEVSLGGAVLPVEEFRRLVRLKIPVVEHRGDWLVFDPEQAEKTLAFLDSGQASGQAPLGELMRHSLGLGPGGLDPGDDASERPPTPPAPVGAPHAEDWLAEVFDRLSQGFDSGPAPVSRRFVGRLRPYQEQGLSWLRFLDGFGLGGCLADDMGLGKTVQLLAMLADDLDAAAPDKPASPTLLVCPTSVMGNWQREARRFVPSLRVRLHHGPQRLRGTEFVRDAERMHLVLVSYGLADRDREELGLVGWRRVVLDEAQNIKNPGTRQHAAVCGLQAQSRFALTGTPIENRLAELWSIFQFLMSGHLGTLAQFQKRFARPIQQERDPTAAATLRGLTAPFLLRRSKSDPRVAGDLPEKVENKVFCALSREQATLYQAVVEQMGRDLTSGSTQERQGLVLRTLLRLKQICDHPALYLGDEDAQPSRSGKVIRLMEMLEEVVEEGQKALVFTQFRAMGELLRTRLGHKLGTEPAFLHGGVDRLARDVMVDRFQNGGPGAPSVLILSLKAGGTGLNLTAASHVFHFDRWWNPAVEDQATDRAFRIGQTRNVLVHKFVCQGTVEELIDQMITTKKDLARAVVGEAENLFSAMSVDQLREAFSLREDAMEDDE